MSRPHKNGQLTGMQADSLGWGRVIY